MQRIPGVQVTRNAGETSGVVIRGLPNVVTTLNGRSIFTAAGRNFSYQDLPAEALGRADVFKSSQAQQIEGGIAGLVDLRLRRPLDFKGLEVAGTVEGVYSRIADKADPRGSFLLSDRWDTGIGDIGVLLSGTYSRIHFLNPMTNNSFPVSANDKPGGAGLIIPQGSNAIVDQGTRRRRELNGSIQWQPTSNIDLYYDGLYTDLKADFQSDYYFPIYTDSKVGIVNPVASDDCDTYDIGTAAAPRPTRLCHIKSAEFTNTDLITSTQAQRQTGYNMQHAVGGRFDDGPAHITADLGYTKSTFNAYNFVLDTTVLNQRVLADTNSGGHPIFEPIGAPQLDPSKFLLSGLFRDWSRSKGSQWEGRTDAKFDIDSNFLKQYQIGVYYAARDASVIGSFQRSFDIPGTTPATRVPVSSRLPAGFLVEAPGGLPYLPAAPWLTPSFDYLRNNQDSLQAIYGLPPGLEAVNPQRSFDVTEKNLAIYNQLVIDSSVGSLPFDGLVGLRIARVQRALRGTGLVAGVLTPFDTSTTGIDVLPNASLRIHATDRLQFRLSAARTISRPAFGQLNPALTLNPATLTRGAFGSGGNPDLTPIKSDSYDATAEYYFRGGGYMQLSGFYRKVNGYIQTFASFEQIPGYTTPFLISRPQSSGSGYLAGTEASVEKFFDFLPGPLSGLGTQLNFTYITGNVKQPVPGTTTTITTPLATVSKYNYNAVLMYEKYGVTGRLAYTYRSGYIDYFGGQGVLNDRANRFKPIGRLDASLLFQLTPNVSISADAVNLTRSEYKTYYDNNEDLLNTVRRDEQIFYVALRFRL